MLRGCYKSLNQRNKNNDDLRELVKSKSRLIDVLLKRIEELEKK